MPECENLTIEEEEESVELIASGYEWTCPHCDTLNHEIEITKTVKCEQCRREYGVDDAGHTWE